MTETQRELMVRSYFEAALWTTNAADLFEEDSALDDSLLEEGWTVDDINNETFAQGGDDCDEFLRLVESNGIQIGDDFPLLPAELGHTFWLLRNGHGVSFDDYPYCPRHIAKALNWAAIYMRHEFYPYYNENAICFA